MYFNRNLIRTYTSVKSNNQRIVEIINDMVNTSTFSTALTHKSYHSIDSSAKSYDTIEYLGDAILQYNVTIFLYSCFPDYSEGKLTEVRSSLVNGINLASISLKIPGPLRRDRALGVYKYLRLGKDKQNIDFNNKSLSKKDSKILADIYESFIAALLIESPARATVAGRPVGNKLLMEFLSLTVLDKPKFKGKLGNFNNVILPSLWDAPLAGANLYFLNGDVSVLKNNLVNSIDSSKLNIGDNISYNSASGNIDNEIIPGPTPAFLQRPRAQINY
jgi:dsRNA-specific ribonuclease